MKSVPERQKATRSGPGDIDTNDSHLVELLLLCGHWGCQAPFWNPPSSLSAQESSPAHQHISTSIGTLQAKQTAEQRHSPTHQEACCLRTPEPTDAPGHSPAHQCAGTNTKTSRTLQPEAQDPVPMTSGLVLATVPASPTSGRHQLQELTSHTSGWAPAPGSPRPQSHPPAGRQQPQDDHSPSGSHLGFSPTHQQANTRFGPCWMTQPAMLETGPTHQRANTSSRAPKEPVAKDPGTWLSPPVSQH